MKKEELFNSVQDPIPPIRRELEIIPVQEDDKSYLYFHDSRGYSTSNLALHHQVGDFLSLIDGSKSINDIKSYATPEVSQDQLLKFVQFLDENRLLASRFFKKYARQTEEEYEQSTVHHPVTVGSSYPDGPEALKQFLDQAFADHAPEQVAQTASPKALYAPHIDPRVGMRSYVRAFSSIRDLTPKRVVIIATSHYAGLHPELYRESPLIMVDKDFEMPLGTIPRDHQAIKRLLQDKEKAGLNARDRAHRQEHSIELHLLFLQYLWQHDFQIVPILVRDISDLYYMREGQLGQQLNYFSDLLNQQFAGDDTFYLISGDLAHFGRKFGDPHPASHKFEEVKNFDQHFLKQAAGGRPEELLKVMKQDLDPFRICGFPPLFTFLNSNPQLRGEVLSYDLWDESERESAVTFGSILYE